MLETIEEKPGNPLLEIEVTEAIAAKTGLTNEEFAKIRKLLGRNPNVIELGIFGAMWSEHCSYKNSKLLLKWLPKEKQQVSAFGKVLVKAGEENAGVIDIGEGWGICFKIESHNHPSAIDPFEGAATGVGGILRDIFTMGARPVLLTNSLRLGELQSENTKRLFRGIVQGIARYGNAVGAPNVGGDIYFDGCYEKNPLVNIFCLGTLRHDQIKKGKASGLGNSVYYVGAATGMDGLGGASFASKELSEESDKDRPAVQKGDSFTEKLLLEACLEAMELPDAVVGIQDIGAAGLAGSLCETAFRGKSGVEVYLDEVPTGEMGMNAYEMLLSESQERMLMIVQKDKEKEVEEIFKKWDLHAVKIGKVTNTGKMVVYHHENKIVDIPADASTEGAPLNEPEYREPAYLKDLQSWRPRTLKTVTKEVIQKALPALLADPTIANKQWVWQQYDHMVLASSVVLPGSDAAIVRLRLDDKKNKYIAIANDCNNQYCYANPYRGAQIAVAECLRNLACSGATGIGMSDNLNFGNPHKPESFFYLRECVRGLASACEFFDLPVVSGNVSLYNESQEGAIDPTPVVSVVGILEKLDDATKQYVERGDEVLILLGGIPHELGMSRYLQVLHRLKTGDAPLLNLEEEKKLHTFILKEIREQRVIAAHDISEGGLLVAICEMLFGQKTFGATIDLQNIEYERADAMLFGESQSRAILAVGKWQVKTIMKDAKLEGIEARVIGEVTNDTKVKINCEKLPLIEWDTKELRLTWENSIPKKMKL